MNATENQLTFLPPVTVGDDELQTETTYKRASATIMYPADATTQDNMNIIEASGALDFWNDPQEDIYDENDGDAV